MRVEGTPMETGGAMGQSQFRRNLFQPMLVFLKNQLENAIIVELEAH